MTELAPAIVTEVTGNHAHISYLVEFDLDEPARFHSGILDFDWNGDTYIAVGGLGAVSSIQNRALTVPSPVTFTLGGLHTRTMDAAADAAKFGSVVKLWRLFRDDAGQKIAEPVLRWSGTVDHASTVHGDQTAVSIVCTSGLAVLDQKLGGRFTAEDQERRFSGDTYFRYLQDMKTKVIQWGGGPVTSTRPGGRSGNGLDQLDFHAR